MQKRSLAGALLGAALISGSAVAEVTVDGIWMQQQSGFYFMARQQGDTAVITQLNPNTRFWDAYIGKVVSNQMTFSSYSADFALVEGSVTFTESSAELIVTRCEPKQAGISCPFPLDLPIPLAKIF